MMEPGWVIMACDESRLEPQQKKVHPAERGTSWEGWKKRMLDKIFADSRRKP